MVRPRNPLCPRCRIRFKAPRQGYCAVCRAHQRWKKERDEKERDAQAARPPRPLEQGLESRDEGPAEVGEADASTSNEGNTEREIPRDR